MKQSNLLQAYHYAQAVRPIKGQTARWGLILINGQEAGLVQMLEAKTAFGLFHGVILDRGPLWFDGFGGAAHVKIFFEKLNQTYPQRWGRKRRILPELQQSTAFDGIIAQCGFEKKEEAGTYQTLWWNLRMSDELARDALKKNWLGSLKKAEKADLKIEWGRRGEYFDWIKEHYTLDKLERGYSGISPKFLANLASFSTQDNPMIIGKATLNGRAIAGVLFFTHGQSATYQVGWSSEDGRKTCAHHLLLWRARDILKAKGIKDLDLGGINDEAKGLSQFKKGTGAQVIILAGHYF
ncbi:MAG: GNAT family N-acetyltransferase [Pseudomonadota bacterium]